MCGQWKTPKICMRIYFDSETQNTECHSAIFEVRIISWNCQSKAKKKNETIQCYSDSSYKFKKKIGNLNRVRADRMKTSMSCLKNNSPKKSYFLEAAEVILCNLEMFSRFEQVNGEWREHRSMISENKNHRFWWNSFQNICHDSLSRIRNKSQQPAIRSLCVSFAPLISLSCDHITYSLSFISPMSAFHSASFSNFNWFVIFMQIDFIISQLTNGKWFTALSHRIKILENHLKINLMINWNSLCRFEFELRLVCVSHN